MPDMITLMELFGAAVAQRLMSEWFEMEEEENDGKLDDVH